ncbi:MAG TPA: hypothetical protein VEK39_09960 [Solirubrobacterales bacterium]|nr:hypothetical protein [Solirubrobacterales bacterium]
MPEFLRSLGAHERLAALGIAIVALSLLLPWYGINFAGGLVKTPLGAFGFIEVAILVTLAAAAYLIARTERGRELPHPLHIGTLIAAAGAWTAVLVAYRIFDRPDFGPEAGPLSAERVGLRYGIFIALAGAALIVAGGLRRRREELAADEAHDPDRRGAEGEEKRTGE